MESSSNNITDVNGSKLGDGRSHSVLESRGGLTPGGEPNQPTHGSWDEESTNRMNATAKSLSHTAAYTMEHKKVNGKYPEVPHLLDKYRIVNSSY